MSKQVTEEYKRKEPAQGKIISAETISRKGMRGFRTCRHFIKRAQQLGFSLKEITELLMLRVDGQTSCEEVKGRTEEKIAEVERKLLELQRMRQALLQVHALCLGRGPTGHCPMLEALDQQEAHDPN